MNDITRILTLLLAMMCLGATARDHVNSRWQRTLLETIDTFPKRGGYYTGGKPNETFSRTTWQGLNEAFTMSQGDTRPTVDLNKATPSFCSSATYCALVAALLRWDAGGEISAQAWRNMMPRVGLVSEVNPEAIGQNDGVGFWGRCNANGPALAVLVNELGAGFSFTAFRGAKTDSAKESPDEPYLTDDQWRCHPVWRRAMPGDLMKIFWNRNESHRHDGGAVIGDDGNPGHRQEAGHSVIFLGLSTDGKIVYWSSNGPGKDPKHMGYSVSSCDPVAIQRVVFTRITRPERFDRVKDIAPTDTCRYLYELNGIRHSTTAELLRECGIK